MTFLDWLLVIVINGAIVGYGLAIARGTRRAFDWFLAAKGLPWWIVGLSMFATAVDSGDYVAIAGGAYTFGISNLTTWWLGLTIGWFVVAYIVFLPMYRTGMFTNAEYLEYRFGPIVRVLSVFIQIQYRTNVLGNIAFSLYLTFSILMGWGGTTWWLVVLIALAAALYTATGGLKSVAVTDAMQSLTMLVASGVLWLVVWNAVGGWSGLEAKFQAVDPKLVSSMLHVGGRSAPGAPATLIVLGWIIVLTAYCVVNHSQAMRMLAARSEWDLKMAALVASVITVIVMWFNITLGILGKAITPDLKVVDQIFPLLVKQYLGPGLIGLVLAGLLASGISTYDSIGSALSAVFTRDIYARFLVKGRDDHHYLQVSRLLTFVMIAISFLYIPFLKAGMLVFYLRLTSVAVMPLFTVYMMGTLTRVSRASGTVGLVVGIVYGLSSFFGARYNWPLPIWWTSSWWAYIWNIVFPALSMVIVSAIWGWAKEEEVRDLVYSARDELEPELRPVALRRIEATAGTWLEATHKELPQMPRYPFPVPAGGLPWYQRPSLWAWLFIVVVGFMNLVILW